MSKPLWLTRMSTTGKIKRLNEARAILLELADDNKDEPFAFYCKRAATDIGSAKAYLESEAAK